MSIDPKNLSATAILTFSDEFDTLSLFNPATGEPGTWNPVGRGFNPEGSSNVWGHEAQFNINPLYDYNRNGINDTASPFKIDQGILTITAQPIDSNFAPQMRAAQSNYWPVPDPLDYQFTSGALNTAPSFNQTYGYFEMRADLPEGAGLWSAFWLLPQDGTWPPEIDVVELLGREPDTAYTSVHSSVGDAGYSMAATGTRIAQSGDGYHTYAVNWQKDYLTYYVDGAEVFKTQTPADMHKPMYMIANLAVGDDTSWPGPANETTPFPAEMKIDYIRAYSERPAEQLTDGSSQPVAPPVVDNVNAQTDLIQIPSDFKPTDPTAQPPASPSSPPAAGTTSPPPIPPTKTSNVTQGVEEVTGRDGINLITGSSRCDILRSGSDNELLVGGRGKDLFVFESDFGHDRIADFKGGRNGDAISFPQSVFNSFDEVRENAMQRGSDVLIYNGNSNSLTLQNVKLRSLDTSDFMFT